MTFTENIVSGNFWPVYKGESFDLWNPDTGSYYAYADPKPVLEWLQKRRRRGLDDKNSPYSEFMGGVGTPARPIDFTLFRTEDSVSAFNQSNQ